ncbi:hypothetical protein ACWGJ6_16355 [Streptomyces canus]|uniref:hypothetical protein n=1 Tax=Streptomyces maremycinicus TaxID=1679753 RepID=UPI0013313582|nr:hypothetical protein [Streptomyces sp. NBRC 110468]
MAAELELVVSRELDGCLAEARLGLQLRWSPVPAALGQAQHNSRSLAEFGY